MSSHKKNLNLQEETGKTFNIALDESKTILKNSTGPIEIQTERLSVKNGVNSQLVDVVGTINKNTIDISTATSSRTAAIASEAADRLAAITSEANSRTAAISTETAGRVAAVTSVITVINTNKSNSDGTTGQLSAQIVDVQSSISSILENADGHLDSFKEIVTAYENADTGLQGFINTITTRIADAENIVDTLTLPHAPTYTGVRSLFQPQYNGSFGYFNIKMVGTATVGPNYLYMEEGGALTVYARPPPTSEGQFGISHEDNDSNPDEHVWKVTVVGPSLFTIENTAYPGQYIGQYGSVSGSTSHVSMHSPPQLFLDKTTSTTDTNDYHMSIKGNDDSKFKAYWYVVNESFHYLDFHALNNQQYNENNTSFKFEPIS